MSTTQEAVLQRLIDWAAQQGPVRALILTSSRTSPEAAVDLFSDYDVIVVVNDIGPFFDQRDWLEHFGHVLVVYRDPIEAEYGIARFRYITQYDDGLKIDFTLWPVDLIRRIIQEPKLLDELDVGYTVLLDKDHLTEGLKPPSRQAHIPRPPTESEYHTLVENFFHEATYAAKHLWRDELLPAKEILDHEMKQGDLRTMLEWFIEMDRNWSVKPGAYGMGLKKLLKPEIWQLLEATYVGASIDENWQALFRTIELFRKVAMEVGNRLRFVYPADLDQKVVAYLEGINASTSRCNILLRSELRTVSRSD